MFQQKQAVDLQDILYLHKPSFNLSGLFPQSLSRFLGCFCQEALDEKFNELYNDHG